MSRHDKIIKQAISLFDLPSNVIVKAHNDVDAVYFGRCHKHGNKIHVTLSIAYASLEKFCQVLCHELVHAKQMLDGRLEAIWLEEKQIHNVIFEGRVFVPCSPKNYDEYMRQPWEVEACVEGDIMADKLIKHMRARYDT